MRNVDGENNAYRLAVRREKYSTARFIDKFIRASAALCIRDATWFEILFFRER